MAEYAYVGPVAHDSGNDNLPIHRIVVHCTASGDAVSPRGTAKYFAHPDDPKAGSAHAITGPDELVICAYDTVVCWHAPPNQHSIGIEIECSLANEGKGHWELDSHQKMLHRAARWVAEKCHEHGIPIRKLTDDDLRTNPNVLGICGHVDVTMAFHESTHTDPGPYFPWTQFLGYVTQEYNAIAGGTAGGTTEEQELAGAVDELKTYITSELTRFFGFLEGPDGNIHQQLENLEGDLEKIVQKYAVAVNTYTRQDGDNSEAAIEKAVLDELAADFAKFQAQLGDLKSAVAALQAAETADHPKG